MAYNNVKNEKLIQSLQHAAELVGEKKMLDGKEVGLGLTAQGTLCQEEAKSVRDGLFRVVVLGTFSAGKSTLINALIRSKVLPESTNPCTAILTYVQYGTDEDDVEIHFKGRTMADGSYCPGAVKHITRDEFLHIYQYNNDDNKEYLETGRMTRLEDVEYSIVKCAKPLMSNGVSIVDSPGLEDKAIATELAMDIFQKSQAIIYMSGERGFAEPDREFFAKHFEGCRNNVFFVLNRFDLVPQENRSVAIENLENNVKPCFTRPDGTVDVELMHKRVFCLSSRQILDSSRGMTYDTDEQQDVPLTEKQIERKKELSQFIPFETALEEFLTTDEKCLAQYTKIVRTLLQTYKKAVDQTEVNLSYYDGVNQMSEEKKKQCEQAIAQIESKIAVTEASFDNCSLKLQGTINDMVRGAIESIDSTWELDLPELHKKMHFGMKDYLSLAAKNLNLLKSREERERDVQKLLMPFSQIIAQYISDKIDDFMRKNQSVIDRQIKDAESCVNENLDGIDELFRQLGSTLRPNGTMQIQTAEGSWLQKLISCYYADLSAVVKGYAGGKTAWMEFIRKTVFNTIWQMIIVTVTTGGMAAFLICLIEWLQIRNGKNEMIDKLLTQSKDGVLQELRRTMGDMIAQLNDDVARKINEQKQKRCQGVRMQLQDEQQRLAEVLDNLSSNSFDAEQERKRTQHILDLLAIDLMDAYETVSGQQVKTVEEINL